MRFSILIALFLGHSSLGSAQPRSQRGKLQEVAPAEWDPSLFQARESLEEELKEAKGQQSMNSLSRRIADIADADLFLAYVRLYERLSPADQKRLIREQHEWLKLRTKHVSDSTVSEGGSAAASEGNVAEIDFTDNRTKELKRRLQQLAPNTP